MAISTFKTFLMKLGSGSDPEYEKLVDIKDFPDLSDTPEAIDVTTLSDSIRKYIKGIQESGSKEFNCNYDKTEFSALKTLADADTELDLAVWFGGTISNGEVTPTGSAGKFAFKGTIDVRVTGGGVNEPVGMAVTVFPSSEISFT